MSAVCIGCPWAVAQGSPSGLVQGVLAPGAGVSERQGRQEKRDLTIQVLSTMTFPPHSIIDEGGAIETSKFNAMIKI